MRVAQARNVAGNEREVISRLFGAYCDVMYLADFCGTGVSRFERLGIPCLDAGTVQEWVAPAQAAEHEQACLWSNDPGDWLFRMVDAKQTFPELDDPPAAPGSSFWHLEGRAIARRSWPDMPAEITAREIPRDVADHLATALLGLLGAGGRIRVPLTQAHLLKALPRHGFVPGQACARWVMVPMLSRSIDPVRVHDFRVTREEVERFGEASGDMNPLHFDDAFARLHGFKGRISHGMLFNGWLTRMLGTEYPGEGTIYLSSRTTYHAPIYPEHDYSIRISAPFVDRGRGSFVILAQLRDEGGGLVALSYNDVLKRPQDADRGT